MAAGNPRFNSSVCAFIVLCLICWVRCSPFYDRHHRVDSSREEYDTFTSNLLMPGVSPQTPDTYLCTFAKMPQQELHIVEFEPVAEMSTVHHMLLYGCEEPAQYSQSWPCEQSTCRGGSKILYAWARNAPNLNLPEDVGFKVGGNSHSKYLVLQVHYNNVDSFRAGDTDYSGIQLHMTYQPQPYIAGIYLLVSMNINIQPGQEQIHTDIVCPYEDRARIHAFAYRTHTHSHGKVVSGYRIRNGEWSLLGKANPQWPQAFYPMDGINEIRHGDTLAARCTFSGKGLDHNVHVGATSHDEMCNFYIMYYMDANDDDIHQACSKNGNHVQFPADSDIPPFPNKYIQDEIEQYYHEDDEHDGNEDYPYMDYYTAYFDDDEKSSEKSETVSEAPQNRNKMTGPDEHDSNDNKDEDVGDEDSHHDKENGEKTKAETITSTPTQPAKMTGSFHEVEHWLSEDIELGQVASVDTDKNGDVVIFHRAHSSWDTSSFDASNHYRKADTDPIDVDVIVTVDKDTGKVKYQWGKGLFYLPHGLTIDSNGNIWVTDVALHQVFKFPPGGSDSPLILLGTKFEPGQDNDHFCKPSDVAVETGTGDFFVSDGYCNSRIVKYSSTGKRMFEWGEPNIHSQKGNGLPPPGHFNLPHAVTLVEDKQQICVADRENGRVQCFKTEDGTFVKQYHPAEFGGRVFGVDYNPANGGSLYVVNGQIEKPGTNVPQSIVMHYDSGEIVDTWHPTQGFNRPHGLAVSADNMAVYVCELDPHRVWKFQKDEKNSSKQGQAFGDEIGSVKEKMDDSLHVEDKSQMIPTLLILMLLAIPIVLMAVAIVILRLRAQGKLRVQSLKGFFNGYRSTSHEVNLGSFFNRHKGFSKVNTEDSDQDENNFSEDSDMDEFTAMNVNSNSQNL
ncbi:peptidyl-glycine alpha-amidating monooxygenase B-like [Ptychodera flava]|uniref:peptidyl-glycine alpha-amidating monooxygenase B-like n=1 Tax=Ptychodera flava TaxID=63121 RepID=UPI00396A557D